MTAEREKEPLIAEAESHASIGAFYDVYNELGPGFPEFISRRAVAIAIREAGWRFVKRSRSLSGFAAGESRSSELT